jgi:hypothetical protein
MNLKIVFSKTKLLFFGIIFAAVGGYFIWSSLAASHFKIWDTDTDFGSAVSKSNVTVSGGQVMLASTTTSLSGS